MRLSDKLYGILNDIRENAGWVDLYSVRKQNLLLYAHRKGLVNDSDIDDALEQGVFENARRFYKQVVAGREYPDHVAFPEFLVYGILNNQFSEQEVGRIKFDHEKDVAEFCRTYGIPNLIGGLRQKLLTPKPVPSPVPGGHSESGGFCESCPPCWEH